MVEIQNIFVGGLHRIINGKKTSEEINYNVSKKVLTLYENRKYKGILVVPDYLGAPEFPVSHGAIYELIKQHKCDGVLLFNGGYTTLNEDGQDVASFYKYAGRDSVKYGMCPYTISADLPDPNDVGNRTFIGVKSSAKENEFLNVWYNHDNTELEVFSDTGEHIYTLRDIYYRGVPSQTISKEMAIKLAKSHGTGSGALLSKDGFIILEGAGYGLAAYYKYTDVSECKDIHQYQTIIYEE